jgi:hypothetical protein
MVHAEKRFHSGFSGARSRDAIEREEAIGKLSSDTWKQSCQQS